MNLTTIKSLFRESFIYKMTAHLNTIYQHSYFKKTLLFWGSCLENSVFLRYLGGKGKESGAYENSLLYRILKGIIKKLDNLFKGLSYYYKTAAQTSRFSRLVKNAGSKLHNKPLMALAFLILGFSVGYLIHKPRILYAGVLLAVNAGVFILAGGDVKLKQMLQTSRLYGLCRYLLE